MITAWAAHQRRCGLMASTITRRCDMVRSFAAWLHGDLAEASRTDIETFLDQRRHMGRPLSDRTRYTWISCLSCFYQWARRDGLVDDNPAARIDRPRLRLPLPRPISDADLARALEHTHGEIHRWLLLGAYGGLSCAEIAALRHDDLLDDLGVIRVLGKGHKEMPNTPGARRRRLALAFVL